MAVAFSPDGKTVLTGSVDKTARLWETATGKPLGPPLQHQNGVGAVAFSPDGRTVLTGSWDNTARLWAVATGKQIGLPLPHQDGVTAVAFSPDGKTVMTGSFDTTLFWEAATGKKLGPPLLHRGRVYVVAFSPDGKSVLTGCHEAMAGTYDGMARLWRLSQVRGNPEQVFLWTQVITGLELDEHGLLRARRSLFLHGLGSGGKTCSGFPRLQSSLYRLSKKILRHPDGFMTSRPPELAVWAEGDDVELCLDGEGVDRVFSPWPPPESGSCRASRHYGLAVGTEGHGCNPVSGKGSPICFPVATAQSRAGVVQLPVSTVLPSGLKATAPTPF